MPRPDDIKDLEGIRFWIAAHHAQIEERWSEQRRINEEHAQRLVAASDKHDRALDRITALERRIAWMSGVAAAIGAIGGSLLSRWM